MSDAAPELAPSAAPEAAAPVAPATPAEAIDASRSKVLASLAKTLEAKASPVVPPVAPGPSLEDERTKRLERAVAADNRARAEIRKATAERQSLEAERQSLRAEREAVKNADVQMTEIRQLVAEGNHRQAMDRILGDKLSDEQFVRLIEQYAVEETPDQIVDRKLAERDKAVRAAREEQAKAELAEREKAIAASTAHLDTAGTAYIGEVEAAWSPDKFPALHARVQVTNAAALQRFADHVAAHPDKEPPSASELLTAWEAEELQKHEALSAALAARRSPPPPAPSQFTRPVALPANDVGGYNVGKVIDVRTPAQRMEERKEALLARLNALNNTQ